MALKTLVKDDQSILNQCAKFLARDGTEAVHNFGQYAPDDPRGRICEAWRFPIIDAYSDGVDFIGSYAFNEVTFVYMAYDGPPSGGVAVVGTFASLWQPVPLRRLTDTPYWTVTAVVPKGQVHTYKYLVGDEAIVDPINPDRVVLDNGAEWSRFFTQLCTVPLVFERWEMELLGRLTSHILPFQTPDGENFLRRFHDYLDREQKTRELAHAYRLDQPVGVVNFIDKLLVREERHHAVDYHTCLDVIDRVLRRRNPYIEPALMPREMFRDLYNEMATDEVPGWQYERYRSPRYFLQLLRRHTLTGAFSHPKYGGNNSGAAWAYLEERYRDAAGQTLFQWRRIVERPLGDSHEYRG